MKFQNYKYAVEFILDAVKFAKSKTEDNQMGRLQMKVSDLFNNYYNR